MTDADPPTDRDPNCVPCAGCGHVWFDGERRHVHADDGSVVCLLCVREHELRRAEDTMGWGRDRRP